ncbi:hypothetical protein BSL78_29000 [Apostichopus japonicus]|uniref:Immunoglobulin subtype domain-containing protein n=1 Tax=Stichopus japonicus TaxID=307972 RepID=A0A2G8JEK0_STIJA|nr:hypothetical protein BSL78_29000 [Apostichopus japonicus]
MIRSGFQTSFILGFVLCLANGDESCDGYSHKKDSEFVNRLLGQDITLSCDLKSNCGRATWAFRTSPVKYLYAGSCPNCGESFSVSDIISGDIMNTSLHMNNINESFAGIYDCNCQYGNQTDRVKCFNIQIKNASCQVELTQNDKAKVFHNSSGSQHDEAVRTVNVNTDDNITVRCINDAAKLNTNCKNKSGLLKVKKSEYRCWISCRINNLCKTRIILSVISSTTNSPSTSMTTEEEVTRRNSSLTSTLSPDDGITAIVSTTYSGKKITMPATMMFVVILAAFVVILIFIVLVLSLKILKGKRKRSAEKEEWINPIYEGFEEGKERDGTTKDEISIIASQPDQETLDEGVYHYVVTSNNNPIHES